MSTENFEVPPGEVASVRIIDSTTSISRVPTSYLMEPAMPGFDTMNNLPTWVFLVESPSGQKAVFDLGVRPDWENMAPDVVYKLHKGGWEIRAEKNVVEILREHKIDPEEINSVIWRGRSLREIDFKSASDLQIGSFSAFDFFGDGSFYLLDTPGHAVGHLAGLARTTKNPDSFILMGGDLCHHGGEIRPSRFMPIPQEIFPHPFEIKSSSPCPGAIFESLKGRQNCGETGSFFYPTIGLDIPEAISTIRKTQVADCRDDIFFVYAHDKSLRGVVDFFPKSANEWKQKGWAKALKWSFLEDFKSSVAHSNTNGTK
ncbi:hypothetical protein H2200_008680 [Cladophialophora chaetospira]|uniref:Metallo-beta-lactamase domain-containing protein n=1 Tax=Cladophialophora chaetospira TaxID=386627 RepID=A0AA38X4I2_9EURO|nr:hypothetical protein H2200_008680 [Cladophialophora chaetospira]